MRGERSRSGRCDDESQIDRIRIAQARTLVGQRVGTRKHEAREVVVAEGGAVGVASFLIRRTEWSVRRSIGEGRSMKSHLTTERP